MLAGNATGKNVGVSDGVRTRDFQIHNLALYRLSYAHHKAVGFHASFYLTIDTPKVSTARDA